MARELLTQVTTLLQKNFFILVYRRGVATCLRAVVLPIAWILVVSYLRLLFLPPAKYGIGTAHPIRNVTTNLFGQTGGRKQIVFINNNTQDDRVAAVIDLLSTQFSMANAQVSHATSEQDLQTLCPTSLLGRSSCYGAVIFQSTPSGSSGDNWAYTVIGDYNMGSSVFVDRTNNEAQLFTLPLVHAVDSAIATVSSLPFPHTMMETPFTSNTNQWYQGQVHEQFMSAIISWLAVICFIAVCGITFHLPGYVATERELGISELIDIMLPAHNRWRTTCVRLVSNLLSFFAIYLPGFLATAAILATRVFKHTQVGVLILYHVTLCGSLICFAHFYGSLFRYARLSGIVIVIFSCALAIVAQWVLPPTTIAVAILVILLPPMNFVGFIRYVATWEREFLGAPLTGSLADQFFPVPGWFYVIGCIAGAGLYSVLALLTEQWLYGIRRAADIPHDRNRNDVLALELSGVSKVYTSFLGRIFAWKDSNVHVLDDLHMSVGKGKIAALLGPNGCGKSTVMESICGLKSIQDGVIEVDHRGGIGFCPQKNVLWDDLTVEEHVKIMYLLKSSSPKNRMRETQSLIDACDLRAKSKARAGTLSGGQKRKLQLAMAFSGGSQLCCIDEASSGLDPLSRRRIWNILMAERGSRTILFTTHALDEADALADEIYMMSRGKISLQGTAVRLKQLYGGGYSVKIAIADREKIMSLPEVSTTYEGFFDGHDFFKFAGVDETIPFLDILENHGVSGYSVEGPSIEKAFLDQARAAQIHSASETSIARLAQPRNSANHDVELVTFSASNHDTETLISANYKRPSLLSQVLLVFYKRALVLRHTCIPLLFAFVIPIIGAALLITAFLNGFDRQGCPLLQSSQNIGSFNILFLGNSLDIPMGPANRINSASLANVFGPYSSLAKDALHIVDSSTDYSLYLQNQYSRIMPGGLYVGDKASGNPSMAYLADGGWYYSALAKGLFDSYLMNTTINTQVAYFAAASPTDMGNSFQMTTYFGLCMIVSSALFALYPNFERRNNIYSLETNNGLLAPAVWLGNLGFDAVVSILATVGCFLVFTLMTPVWYATGTLAAVFLLFGLASILHAYLCAIVAKSSLGAFTIAAGSQAVVFLLYFLLYFVIVAFDPNTYDGLKTLQFALGLVAPSANLMRALLLSLNAQYMLCRRDGSFYSPGSIAVYGGPLLYLTLQFAAYLLILLIHDSRALKSLSSFIRHQRLSRKSSEIGSSPRDSQKADLSAEVQRTKNCNISSSLRILHANKTFSNGTSAVTDLTFCIEESECFALLGPNGAGKTTMINMIRGNVAFDESMKSDIIVCGHSMSSQRQAAIDTLSVCPQFDAIDYLTVSQHLRFYGKAAGVPVRMLDSVVSDLVCSLDLAPFADRMASKLSGGNKRKLSLAIALIGKPRLLILDEPSSGMDALSMRMMWRTLRNIRKSGLAANMAVLMTSHSMEEVNALADRVGIMHRTMLAIGEKGELSSRYQNRYHVHLVLQPLFDQNKYQDVVLWIKNMIPGSTVDQAGFHGQIRFSFPTTWHGTDKGYIAQHKSCRSTPASVLRALKTNKERLFIEYYTLSHSTLEDVFLRVIQTDED